jgi:ABC-type branched-subunit amino acid transport system permease subunit
MMKAPKNSVKYAIGLLTVIGLRLLPHPPNVEPIMATMMPFSKKWGWFSGMMFCLVSVLSFDLLTGTLGIWSLVTAGTYALLGVMAGLYLKNKSNKIRYYVGFSIVATLLYDAITGIGIGMVFFDQQFMPTVVGQIPFTLYHLGGNIILSAIVSPVLLSWVIENPKLETQQLSDRLGLVFKPHVA